MATMLHPDGSRRGMRLRGGAAPRAHSSAQQSGRVLNTNRALDYRFGHYGPEKVNKTPEWAVKKENESPLRTILRLMSIRARARFTHTKLLHARVLYLESADVRDIKPLEVCSELEELTLLETGVTDIGPLVACTKLKYLKLPSTPISDISPLPQFWKLTNLCLRGTKVTDIDVLRHCTQLRNVNLSGTEVSDVSPLADCPLLVDLMLDATKVEDIKPLMWLERLKFVEVTDSLVEPEHLRESNGETVAEWLWDEHEKVNPGQRDLLHLNRAQVLEWTLENGNKYSTRDRVRWGVFMNEPQVVFKEELSDDELCIITELTVGGHALRFIDALSLAHSLVKLVFTGIVRVSDLGPLRHCPKLKILRAYGCPVADLTPLESLFELEEVNVARTQVTDLGPLANCSKLVTLDIRNTTVGDISVVRGFTALQTLLAEHTSVENVGPLANCTELALLDIQHTEVVDVTPLSNLVINCNLAEVRMEGSLVEPEHLRMTRRRKVLKRYMKKHERRPRLVKAAGR